MRFCEFLNTPRLIIGGFIVKKLMIIFLLSFGLLLFLGIGLLTIQYFKVERVLIIN